MADNLTFQDTGGKFKDRYSNVPVYRVEGGKGNFAAFVYQCKLNLDIDGAPRTYGFNRPGSTLQKDLDPLESWHKGWNGVTTEQSQKVGLGNACGDPGDGTKGWRNFLDGSRNFYWAGLISVTVAEGRRLGLIVDDRPELEAGLKAHAKDGKPKLAAVGEGWFPVVQDQSGTAPGYYISATSVIADASLSHYNPHRYLNATVVPYAVWAGEWSKHHLAAKTVRQGDYGLAINSATGTYTGFVFGDAGTPVKVGESSQKLHDALGAGGGLVAFLAFPGSGNGIKLGANPEGMIPVHVLLHMMKLGANARQLAVRLAMGQSMTIPPGTAEMSFDQDRRYKAFMKALSAWTIT